MKIAYDAKRAVSNNTGLGNYSRLVIEETARSHREDQLMLYTPRIRENIRLQGINAQENVEWFAPRGNNHGAYWRSWGLTHDLLKDKPDIFHGLSNELPLNIRRAGIPAIVTIHDIIYRRLPSCYERADRILYNLKYGRSCRQADKIIAISECTKRDIMHFYQVPEERIEVIYQGCHPSFRKVWGKEKLDELASRLSLPEHYVLQVGTVETRKNLELTIRALAALPQHIKLLAVGRDNGYKAHCEEVARRTGVSHRVIFMHYASFADLPGICQRADIIAYPSRYEGFGLPVIEGLESRRPVVAATGSCLEEAGGDAAIYVNPDDAEEMGRAMLDIIEGRFDIEGAIQRGLRHVEQFNTDRMVDKIHNLYEKTITDFHAKK